MKSVRLVTPPPVGVGTRGDSTVRILGMTVSDPVTVTEFEPADPLRGPSTKARSPGPAPSPSSRAPTARRRSCAGSRPFALRCFPNLGARVGFPVLAAVFQADLERLRRLVESGAD